MPAKSQPLCGLSLSLKSVQPVSVSEDAHSQEQPLQDINCKSMLWLQGQGMRDAEMLVWAGDFNYRIEASYEDALDHINRNELDWLLERVSFGYACNG